MRFSSILLFLFLFIDQNRYTFSFWSKSKNTLENYVIDVLFTNSLTIIRCNPYERHILRIITIETVGHIQCSNSHLFLPKDHIRDITLLQWNYTSIECSKDQKKITKEKTYFFIKHKADHAFRKIPFDIIRAGSIGSSRSKIDEKKFQLSFEHLPRNLALVNAGRSDETFTTEIYSFKNRPILCRERQLVAERPCSNQHLNLSYVCYYKIGVPEPPTIAEMENELRMLPSGIYLNGDEIVDRYVSEKPKPKCIWTRNFLGGVGIAVILIFAIAGISGYCYCRSRSRRRTDSDTSR